tara:strand:- start:788 stop:1366 length:579 start_codon:yes stop_codon:yes gene_type:complete
MSNLFTHQKVHYVPKPMPVFTAILDDHVEFNKYLKQVILEHRQNNPETNNSNVKAWHSSWTTHKDNPKFQPFIDRVLDSFKFISKAYFECELDYSVVNMWAMMYEKSEHTVKHCHYPSDMSCCYYVDVDSFCAPIIFESIEKDGVNDYNNPLTIQPENGMLAVWPGILQHEVPMTKGKRMCISMNANKNDQP